VIERNLTKFIDYSALNRLFPRNQRLLFLLLQRLQMHLQLQEILPLPLILLLHEPLEVLVLLFLHLLFDELNIDQKLL
jgi:hypothetical protein